MTSRERLLKVLRGELPDCVPVSPDFSNMMPAKLTGLPFWDIYLHHRIPSWEAFIKCAEFFDIDALMDGYFPLTFPEETAGRPEWSRAELKRTDDMIITRRYYMEDKKPVWHDKLDVYHIADSPAYDVSPDKLEMPEVPEEWKPIEDIEPVDRGPEGLRKVKELMGDQGLVGVFCASSVALACEEDVFNYYDNPDKRGEWAAERVEKAERRFERIMAMEVKPDFLCVGGSGTLIFQTADIFRELAFPAVRRVVELAAAAGMPTHVHSCGPERELVKIMVEETGLTVIDPLEKPPMGDCDLAELKRLYGDKITLKGNLHTTDVMLNGTVEEVVAASKEAIDAAAGGGRFILSTGDQCGRDTPFDNIRAMVDTARSYGRY